MWKKGRAYSAAVMHAANLLWGKKFVPRLPPRVVAAVSMYVCEELLSFGMHVR